MLQQLEIKRLRKHREQAFDPFSHSSDRREQQPAEIPAAASSHMQVEAGIRTELGIAAIQRKVERAGAAPAQPAAGGSCNSYCKDACSQFVKPTDSVWECSACTARQVGARGCFPGAMGYMGYNAIRGGRAVEAAADEWERAEATADAQATAHEQAMGEEPAPPAVLEAAADEWERAEATADAQATAHEQAMGEEPAQPTVLEAAADEWERAEAAADAQATAHEQPMGEEPAPPAVLVLKPAGEETGDR